MKGIVESFLSVTFICSVMLGSCQPASAQPATNPPARVSNAELLRQSEARMASDAARIQRERAEAAQPAEVAVGMTTAQVRAVLKRADPWQCAGAKVNRTETARGVHEQWVCYLGTRYLYFDNGILTAIQSG